ncbi:MAG: hypothetical protein H6810_12180 [Phycisphaeraceae bacterium]|nr:MAG: hypothetical protein H6810_12180 [Phycisphaeraceae bacterium]
MTLDNTELLTITESALTHASALCTLAGQTVAACQARPMIVIVGASAAGQSAMDRRVAGLGASSDVERRANLITLPARENAQRFSGLLAMLGVDVRLLDPALFAPITRGNALEAEPRLLHAKRYEQAIQSARVLVLAGGTGRTPDGHITSLGTGGPILTGLFVAQRLGVPVRLITDERGLGDAGVLPKRAALFARRHGLSFGVSTRIDQPATQIPEVLSA